MHTAALSAASVAPPASLTGSAPITATSGGLEPRLPLQPDRGRRRGTLEAGVAGHRRDRRRVARPARSDAVHLERDLVGLASREPDQAAGELAAVRGVREA